jgi:ribosomal protein L16 Arg81 hydroxylase
VYQQLCRHPVKHAAFLSGDAALHERQKGAVSLDVTLRPGDFLYLPAGYYHQAICTGAVSAHLSFGVVEMIGLDVVSELFEKAVLGEFFRTPIGRSVRNGNRPLADYLKALAETIEALMTDEAFVRSIESRLESFPWPADEVAFKKEGGA